MQYKESPKLRECPFCGGEAEAFEDYGNFGVRCKNFNCIGYDIEPQYLKDVYAIEACNRRAAKTPCDLCKFNPPTSMDGKPCTMCVADGRAEDGK